MGSSTVLARSSMGAAPVSSHQAGPVVTNPRLALESRGKACRGSKRKTILKLGRSEEKLPGTKGLGEQRRSPKVTWRDEFPAEQPQDRTGTEKIPASCYVTLKTVLALSGPHFPYSRMRARTLRSLLYQLSSFYKVVRDKH